MSALCAAQLVQYLLSLISLVLTNADLQCYLTILQNIITGTVYIVESMPTLTLVKHIWLCLIRVLLQVVSFFSISIILCCCQSFICSKVTEIFQFYIPFCLSIVILCVFSFFYGKKLMNLQKMTVCEWQGKDGIHSFIGVVFFLYVDLNIKFSAKLTIFQIDQFGGLFWQSFLLLFFPLNTALGDQLVCVTCLYEAEVSLCSFYLLPLQKGFLLVLLVYIIITQMIKHFWIV